VARQRETLPGGTEGSAHQIISYGGKTNKRHSKHADILPPQKVSTWTEDECGERRKKREITKGTTVAAKYVRGSVTRKLASSAGEDSKHKRTV